MGGELGAVCGAEPVGFGDVFFEEGELVFLKGGECFGVVDDAFEVFFYAEDHGVVWGVLWELGFEAGSELGESCGVVLVDEEDEACLEEHLLFEAGFFPLGDGVI